MYEEVSIWLFEWNESAVAWNGSTAGARNNSCVIITGKHVPCKDVTVVGRRSLTKVWMYWDKCWNDKEEGPEREIKIPNIIFKKHFPGGAVPKIPLLVQISLPIQGPFYIPSESLESSNFKEINILLRFAYTFLTLKTVAFILHRNRPFSRFTS